MKQRFENIVKSWFTAARFLKTFLANISIEFLGFPFPKFKVCQFAISRSLSSSKRGKKAAALKGSIHQRMPTNTNREWKLYLNLIYFFGVFSIKDSQQNTLKLQHEFVHDVTTLVGIVFRSANHWAQWFINGFWSGNHQTQWFFNGSQPLVKR